MVKRKRLFQYGGKVRINDPFVYEPTQDTQVDLKAFMPDSVKSIKRPTIDTSKIDIKGYDSDVSHVMQQIESIQNQIDTLPEPLLNPRLPGLVAKARYYSSPEYLNRAKANYEQGKEMQSKLGSNKGESAWLTTPSGQVLVRTYDPNTKKYSIDSMDLADATARITQGTAQAIKGSEAWQIRNDELRDMEAGDVGNTFHTAMGATKGMEKVTEEIENFKTDASSQNKVLIDNFQPIPHASPELIGMLLGKRTSGSLLKSNEQQYAQAIEATRASLSETTNNSLKSHAAIRLMSGKISATDNMLGKYGLDYKKTMQDLNNSDPQVRAKAKADFNSLVEMEKNLLIANQLKRHTFLNKETSVQYSPSQWMTDKATGEGEYKAPINLIQGAFNGLTQYKSYGASGKYSSLTLKGNSMGNARQHAKGDNLAFNNSAVRDASDDSQMFYPDGTPVSEEMRDHIFNSGSFVDDQDVVIVSMPHVNGKMVQLNQMSSKKFAELQEMDTKYKKGQATQEDVLKARNAFEIEIAREMGTTQGEVPIEYRKMIAQTVAIPEAETSFFTDTQFEKDVQDRQFVPSGRTSDQTQVQKVIGSEISASDIYRGTIYTPVNNEYMLRIADKEEVRAPESARRASNLVNQNATISAGTTAKYGLGNVNSLNNP